MKVPPSDDDLRQRVRELGRREADTAPVWDRVWLGGRPTPGRMPVAAGSGWRRSALALAGALLVVAAVMWWPMRPESGGPVVAPAESVSNDAAEEWVLPTDGLLTEKWDGAGEAEAERLSREIDALLQS